MGVDQHEASRQRANDKPKGKTRHPFVAIEHRVIDSEAYADLGFAARALLVLMARQLTKDNNGHLQATFSWCQRYGFGSEHTLRAAIADLIANGFIYRTRSHGANGAWARYALTWLPIVRREGLFLAALMPNAWRNWTPAKAMTNGKSSRQEVLEPSGIKCSFPPEFPAESAGKPTAESADYESCCHVDAVFRGAASEIKEAATTKALIQNPTPSPSRQTWMPAYLDQLAACGLVGHKCFQIPAGVTVQ